MPRNPDASVVQLTRSMAGEETSLLDLVDNLLGKGVVVDGEVVLGLAGVDLVYLRLAALLAAADRIAKGPSPPAGEGEPPVLAPSGGGPAPSQGGPSPGAPAPDALSPETTPPPGDAPAEAAARAASTELFDLPDADARHAAGAVHVAAAPASSVAARDDGGANVSRWNPDPEEVRKGVMKLVLALAEFIRQLMERQAVRRLEAGTLSDDEAERLGTALSHLEQTLREMAERAGLDPDDVNLDLGPLGRLV